MVFSSPLGLLLLVVIISAAVFLTYHFGLWETTNDRFAGVYELTAAGGGLPMARLTFSAQLPREAGEPAGLHISDLTTDLSGDRGGIISIVNNTLSANPPPAVLRYEGEYELSVPDHVTIAVQSEELIRMNKLFRNSGLGKIPPLYVSRVAFNPEYDELIMLGLDDSTGELMGIATGKRVPA